MDRLAIALLVLAALAVVYLACSVFLALCAPWLADRLARLRDNEER